MKSLSISLAVLALSTATVMCTGAQAQKDPAKDSSTRSYKIEVSGTKGWVNTDIDVRGGAKLRFTEDQMAQNHLELMRTLDDSCTLYLIS